MSSRTLLENNNNPYQKQTVKHDDNGEQSVLHSLQRLGK